MKKQQALDREERAACGDTQKIQEDVQMAQMKTDGKEKWRADEIQILEIAVFVDEKDKLDSYLLCFERYAKNAKWKKVMWIIKLSALLSGRAMDVIESTPGCSMKILTTTIS